MVLTEKQNSITIDGNIYFPNMQIRATPSTPYNGLYGHIIEICGTGMYTENTTVDIACEFYHPYDDKGIKKLEKKFTELYGIKQTADDIALDYVIMAPDMIRPLKKCRIYQIVPGNELASCSLAQIKEKGYVSPPRSVYKEVYDGEIYTENLETIFMIFNIDCPHGYMGRPLSVSDVVELYDGNGSRFYYCDQNCFVKTAFETEAVK